MVLVLAVAAEQSANEATARLAQWNSVLDRIAEAMAADGTQSRALSAQQNNEFSQQLGALLAETEQLKQQAEQALDVPRAELKALGPKPKEDEAAEAAEITQQRRQIEQTIADIEARIKQAELIAARAEEQLKQLSQARQTELQQHLLTRSPSLFSGTVWRRAGREVERFVVQTVAAFSPAETTTSTVKPIPLVWLGLALTASIILLWPVRKGLLRHYGPNEQTTDPSYWQRTLAAFAEGTARGLLPAAAVALIMAAVLGQLLDNNLLRNLVIGAGAGLIFYLLVSALLRATLAPAVPAWRLVALSDQRCRRLAWRVEALAAACAVLLALYLYTRHWTPLDAALETVAKLISSTVLALLILPLLRKSLWQSASVQHTAAPQQARLLALLRVPLVLLSLSVPVLALAGYTNLASFLIIHLIGSAVIVCGFLLLRKLFLEVGNTILSARKLNVDQEAAKPSHLRFWLELVVDSVLALPALALLALFWGIPQATLTLWGRTFLEGVTIGELTFSPGDILLAVCVFVAVLIITRVLKRVLRDRVIARTGLDQGVQHSLVIGFGYLGILCAILLTVAVLGLSLTNLALIFGALSIGIGLGLQNVVNNFVSGLILLIQRPIKVGDWVVIGPHEGYVKSIQAISTELETYDHASVIIPNSEMVSSAVVNWTHTNRTIRISVQVGVAYGSDIQQVREILMRCAAASDEVLQHPEPEVLFTGFGPSSLDFELGAYILNADNRKDVSSDIRTAVAQALDEAGIAIPFPQQEILLKNADRIADAFFAQRAPELRAAKS